MEKKYTGTHDDTSSCISALIWLGGTIMLKRNLRIISLHLAIILAVQMSGILEISAQARNPSQNAAIKTETKPEIIGEVTATSDDSHNRMAQTSVDDISLWRSMTINKPMYTLRRNCPGSQNTYCIPMISAPPI
jgi:hypothetical protein